MPSEINNKEYLEGERESKENMDGSEIFVLDYVIMDSKYKGKYGVVQARADYSLVTFIVNDFMLKQLKQVSKEKFPFKLRVKKKDKYWRFESSA